MASLVGFWKGFEHSTALFLLLLIMQELHPCGAETLYMDPAYLQEIVEGMLRVHVRHAVGLTPPSEQGECNAFATAAVGPSAGKLPNSEIQLLK